MTSPAQGLKKAGGLSMLLGILLLVLGVLAIGSPLVTGLAVAYIVGFLILMAGVGQTFHAFQAEAWQEGILKLLLGALGIVVGVLVIAHPLFSLGWLTLVLAAYFFIDGIFEIILAFRVKPEQGWGWMLFAGIVAVLAGILIWRQWPLSGEWLIGLLVGIKIIFAGWAMIATGSVGRQLGKAIE
jgi:uncharacterized membrane protein HdeD (DUF308 family)